MLSHLLDPIVFLLSAAGLFFGSGALVVLILTASQRSKILPALLISAIGLGAAVVGAALIGPFSYKLLEIAAVFMVVDLLLYQVIVRPSLDWQSVKFARASARQTTLHMVLLFGSLIFMVPFAWLVVTSLKEESEMSKFPPVWLPTQQVEVMVLGKSRKEDVVRYQGEEVKVGELEEFDNGQRRVQVVEPARLAGQAFICDKSALKPIRHFDPVWKNYPDALKFLPPETHYGLVFLGNTLEITILSILGTLISSSMVAYGFARLRWPGRDALFVVLLATMMLPGAVTMMPVFLIFRWLGWIDTLKPLWAPSFFGSAFNIFMLRQFFLGIPTELEDAAKLDGCSYYAIFWRIMLPQLKPALAAITIMAFMGAWNDFQRPLIYISSPEKLPLAYALQLFQTSHGGEPGMLMAASTLVMLPVLALFFFTQRYFIQGVTLTGIKG